MPLLLLKNQEYLMRIHATILLINQPHDIAFLVSRHTHHLLIRVVILDLQVNDIVTGRVG